MNNRSIIITLIVALSVICVSLVAGMIILMNKDIGFSFGLNFTREKMKLVETQDADASRLLGIELNLYSADVEIKERNDSDLVTIEYYSNKEVDNIIKYENEKLIVDEDDSKLICLGICSNNKRVIIYVPSSFIGSYNINTTSGDIKSYIDTMENNISIKTTSGDIVLKNTVNTSITTTSGDIELYNVKDANLHSTSGDISIRGEVKKLEVGTTSGDIKVSEITKTMSIATTSGTILIDSLSIVDNSNINTVSGDIKVNNNNSDCYVEFSTISGSNHIKKSNRKSDIVLSVHTISGDIRVN